MSYFLLGSLWSEIWSFLVFIGGTSFGVLRLRSGASVSTIGSLGSWFLLGCCCKCLVFEIELSRECKALTMKLCARGGSK